jgi:hypothetical protein
VTWLEGDYRVTYADAQHVKSWVVMGGKVTSEPDKGYYYFWVKKMAKSITCKRLLQVAILKNWKNKKVDDK